MTRVAARQAWLGLFWRLRMACRGPTFRCDRDIQMIDSSAIPRGPV
jgi:hypothetical protein